MKNSDAIPQQLLTIPEVSKYLAVSERTAWTLAKDGRLPVVRFGRITRIAKGDIDLFIESMKTAKSPE